MCSRHAYTIQPKIRTPLSPIPHSILINPIDNQIVTSLCSNSRGWERDMADLMKRYILASDFDQTLSFNDSGYALSEMLGISTEEFERKAAGMAGLQLVQQGAELA